jgi:hydroxyacylglutathione hydrolase
MFASLRKLAVLPGETKVCCGHEYTESNARFALSIDPENQALQARAAQVKALRAAGRPTIPSLLSEEMVANPFLLAKDVDTFAQRRAAKDKF